ncbi:MAG: DUF6326 family protein [Methanomassiliicoccales archaeon]|jgi:hypothetical protein
MVEHDQMIGIGRDEKLKMRGHNGKNGAVLEELRIPTQLKLSGLWATVMFMYVYVDIIGFFAPGVIEDILVGKTYVFEITQMFMLSAVVLMTVPALMVFLSMALPAKASRYANIVIGAIYIIMALGLAVGESNLHYIFGSVVEAILLSLIVWIAWKWPKVPRHIEVGN